MNNLELTNANQLEEGLVDSLGVNNDNYSYCCGADGTYYYADATPTTSTATSTTEKKGFTLDADKIQKGIQLGTALLGKIQQGRTSGDAEIDTVCGQKPACLFGGGCGDRKKEWQRCVDNQKTKSQNVATSNQNFQLEQQRLQNELEQKKIEQARLAQPQGGGDKFLGMPKAVGITVTVVGGLALLVGGFLIIKKIRKG